MADPVITNEVVAYGKHGKDEKYITIRYTYTTDTLLTAGLTAAELIAKVTKEELPAVDTLKYLKTRVAKRVDGKYMVIASLRYVAA